jgi:hypothetical protein
MQWAKGWGVPNARYGVVEDVFTAPSTQPAKIKFVNWLTARYTNNIFALNQAWGTAYGDFSSLLLPQAGLPSNINATMEQDFRDFVLLYARTYFAGVRQALTASNYKGLYLGCRFLYFAPELLQACKEYADVCSFNCYDLKPSDYHSDFKNLDMPVMISEFGFGASDLGRINFWPNILTEAERVNIVDGYLKDAEQWSNLIGLNWYQWTDDIVSGIYPDYTNHSLGLNSIADVPYTSLVNLMKNHNYIFNRQLIKGPG